MIKHLLFIVLLLQGISCSGHESEAPMPSPAPGNSSQTGQTGQTDDETGNSSQTGQTGQTDDETGDSSQTGDNEADEPQSGVVRVSSAAEVKALGTVKAGTKIVWINGLYPSQVVDLKAEGEDGNPVILCAETPGKVVFTGESRVNVSGHDAVVEGFWWRNPKPVASKAVITLAKGSSSCTVRDCSITGENTAEDKETDNKWVSLYGTGHTVENCTFNDKRNIGTLLVVWLEDGVTPSHTIAANRFSRPVTLVDDNGKALNGQETIRIGTSDYSMQEACCTVENNYFYHCHGEQAEIVSNKSCRNVYRRNVFVESQGSLTLRHGNDCTVTGNYFFGNDMPGTGGIRIIGERHTVEYNYLEGLAGTGYRTAICIVRGQENPKLSGYWQVKDAHVSNNVLVNCKYGFMVNYGSASSNQTQPVISTVIENNTVSASSKSQYTVNVYTDPKPEVTWKNNKLYNGKQAGVELGTVSSDPVSAQVRSAMKAAAEGIRQTSGCSWEE